MSLSTQLTRGALALPMLLGFAGLGLLASQGAEAERVMAPIAVVDQVFEAHRADHTIEVARLAQSVALERLSRLCAGPGRGRMLVLAQAPADLGNLAIRWSRSCRA